MTSFSDEIWLTQELRIQRQRPCWFGFLLAGWLVVGGSVAVSAPPDKVVTPEEILFGRIQSTSPNAIDFEGQTGGRRQIGVDELVSMQFGEEPRALTDARRDLLEGNYAAALAGVTGISSGDLEGGAVEIRADYDYVRAAAEARQALASDTPSRPARDAVEAFLKRYSRTIRRYEMIELAGQLALASGDRGDAIAWYQQLASGPPAFAIRAARLEGEAWLVEHDTDEAMEAFDRGLAIRSGDAASRQEKLATELGRAACLIEQGQPAEAVVLVRQVLAKAEPPAEADVQATQTVARGYVLLGDGYLAADEPQDALLAYLTVDLVYPRAARFHAESLFRLVKLWSVGGFPQRAAEARRRLEALYPQSRWAADLSASTD
jgi:tetratricopeptide (TPR) repeat protein